MLLPEFLLWLRNLGVTGDVGRRFLKDYLSIEDSLSVKPNTLEEWIAVFEAWGETQIRAYQKVN